MFRMLRILPLILAMAALGIFAASCGTDHAQMRFVQASPDLPGAENVDVTVDTKSFATGLPYLGVSPATGYTSVNSGSRAVEVFVAGTTTNPLINSNISLSGGQHYTVLASGDVGSLAAVVLTDNNTAPSSGNVNLRVIHDSPSAPTSGTGPGPLDIYIVPPGTDIINMSPNIPSLQYQQASTYQPLAAGPLQVIATQTGDVSKTPLANQTYNDLTAGQVRSFVIVDVAGGGQVSLSPLELSDLN